jgi:AraC-like DNA-binding protein
MQFSDPVAFEQFLAPVSGAVRVRPAAGARFRANLEMRELKRVGLFTIEADSFSVLKAPQQSFYGLTIPLNTHFSVFGSGYEQTFSASNAHMLSPGKSFDLQCKESCLLLVSNFLVDSLEEYRKDLLQEIAVNQRPIESKISLISSTGSKLYRSVVRLWVALSMENFSTGDISLQEMEDDLLANFLSLLEHPQATENKAALPSDYVLRHAEDYICANLQTAITRDKLANVTGVSIRSLSRKFEIEHGIGPMAFIRQRRLDACYAQLRFSKPGDKTVTDVALSHGFNHIGKFAIAYKNVFGESPSSSLAK